MQPITGRSGDITIDDTLFSGTGRSGLTFTIISQPSCLRTEFYATQPTQWVFPLSWQSVTVPIRGTPVPSHPSHCAYTYAIENIYMYRVNHDHTVSMIKCLLVHHRCGRVTIAFTLSYSRGTPHFRHRTYLHNCIIPHNCIISHLWDRPSG